MVKMRITARHIAAARAAGACEDELRLYRAGDPLDSLSPEAAAWVEEYLPDMVAKLRVPLWLQLVFEYGYIDWFPKVGNADGSGVGDALCGCSDGSFFDYTSWGGCFVSDDGSGIGCDSNNDHSVDGSGHGGGPEKPDR